MRSRVRMSWMCCRLFWIRARSDAGTKMMFGGQGHDPHGGNRCGNVAETAKMGCLTGEGRIGNRSRHLFGKPAPMTPCPFVLSPVCCNGDPRTLSMNIPEVAVCFEDSLSPHLGDNQHIGRQREPVPGGSVGTGGLLSAHLAHHPGKTSRRPRDRGIVDGRNERNLFRYWRGD